MPRDEPRTRFAFAEPGVSPASVPVRTPAEDLEPKGDREAPGARHRRGEDTRGTGTSPRLEPRDAVAVCTAPGEGGHEARVIGPADITPETRGTGANTRHIHSIAMEQADVADRLLVTEVYTPSGNWSSYPPHRHDEDDFPNITFLEETYYHRVSPAQGFGVQRVFTEDGSLDETMAVADHDVVLVPRGHHPVGAPYGYELYYLNVMAGPIRKWRFRNHPDHEWVIGHDAA